MNFIKTPSNLQSLRVWIASGAQVLKDIIVGLRYLVRHYIPDKVVVFDNPEQMIKHFHPQVAREVAGGIPL
jgi:acetyltransferase-like isoleucine patch superfamily enzyme